MNLTPEEISNACDKLDAVLKKAEDPEFQTIWKQHKNTLLRKLERQDVWKVARRQH